MSQNFDIAGEVFCWVAILGFLGWRINRSESPRKLIFKCIGSIGLTIGEDVFVHHLIGFLGAGMAADFAVALVMVGSVVACGVILSIIWAPHIGGLLSRPLTSLFDGGDEPPEPKPYYSIANSKRKQGKFLEAVVELRKQLDRFPDDFEGVALLANIQAQDLNDLASAEMTLNHFCAAPNQPPQQVAAALTQLADWHLKLAQDADSARTALEKIIGRFPDSELALQAAQRLARLAGANRQLAAAQDRQPVFLPEGENNIGLLKSSAHLAPAGPDPRIAAAEFVKHLAQHPDDAEAREKLAVIYADHYQRLEMAAGELNQLIEQPNQPAKRVAHWLNLLADLQIRHGADYETARRTLERIVVKLPDSAAAERAKTRLAHLKLELKGRMQSSNVPLGVYEQNIGLKYGSPRKL